MLDDWPPVTRFAIIAVSELPLVDDQARAEDHQPSPGFVPWAEICSAAVRVIEMHGEVPTHEEWHQGWTRRGAGDQVADWAYDSLSCNPIDLSEDRTTYVNGRHRSARIQDADVEFVVIALPPE